MDERGPQSEVGSCPKGTPGSLAKPIALVALVSAPNAAIPPIGEGDT